MSDCIFCNVISGKLPSTVLYQDDQIMVIKDIYPQAPVHWLVITKKHYDELLDLPENLLTDMIRIVRKVIRDEKIAKYRIVNNGKGAAFVGHVHIHVMGQIDKSRAL